MTNQEWLQQHNARIEAMRQKLEHKVGANGTIEITENGKYDVAGYSDANVNVPVPDLSATTATDADVLQGKKFYNAQGELVAGGYKDMLQRKVNATKSCKELFANMPDEDMNWVKNLDTTGVTTMQSMFYNCTKAKTIDVSNFDTNSVNTMNSMFNVCTELKNIIGLNNIKGSNVTNILYMFDGCKALEDIDMSSFEPLNITTISRAFYDCSKAKIINIQKLKTENVNNISLLFGRCEELETVLGTLDMINVTSNTDMLYMCYKLKDIVLKNIKVSLNIKNTSSLSNESLINIFKELHDLTGGTSQTLRLHNTSKANISNIYVKLIDVTDEMRAEDQYIDNKKPCVVCESTDAGAMTLTEYAISKNWSIA